MGREELLAALRELGDRGHGAAGFKPHYAIEQEILAEFDRLEEANKALQAQLAKISEPYHYSRDKAEYPWIRHEGKADGCPICNPKPIPHTTQGWKDRIWPVKPARCEHSDSSGVFWEGLTKDCPICNPAPHIYVDSHGEEWSHSGLEKDCPICRLKPLSEKLP